MRIVLWEQIVRLGHPARVSECVQRLTLDALLHSVDSSQIILEVRKDIKKNLVCCFSPCVCLLCFMNRQAFATVPA